MIKVIILFKILFIVDYIINNYYLNDCKYFGLDFVDFEDWVKNINLYLNVIYEINLILEFIDKFEVENIFDLVLLIIFKGYIVVEGYVVLDFKGLLKMSKGFWCLFDCNDLIYRDKFFLNIIVYVYK